MKLQVKGTLLAALVLLGASYASANVIWTLNNVTYADGGVATGSFTLDPSGNFIAWNISISGGDTVSFPPVTYTTGEPSFNTPGYVAFADIPFDRYTLFFFAGPLPNTGGTVPLTAGLDCYIGPCRTEASGELDGVLTAVPESGTFLMFGSGLLAVGAMMRRRFLG